MPYIGIWLANELNSPPWSNDGSVAWIEEYEGGIYRVLCDDTGAYFMIDSVYNHDARVYLPSGARICIDSSSSRIVSCTCFYTGRELTEFYTYGATVFNDTVLVRSSTIDEKVRALRSQVRMIRELHPIYTELYELVKKF